MSWDKLSGDTVMIIKSRCAINLPKYCNVDSDRFMGYKWKDGLHLNKIKARNVYNTLMYDETILGQANELWNAASSVNKWWDIFSKLWSCPIAQKIKCFKWVMTINRLPCRSNKAIRIYAVFVEPQNPLDISFFIAFLPKKTGYYLVYHFLI